MSFKSIGLSDDLHAYLVAHNGPADPLLAELTAETRAALPRDPHLDLAFIDADKVGYPTYWEELVPRMRPGGVLVVDNVLRHGQVLAPTTPEDRAIVAFNDQVQSDPRVTPVMLPLGDGLTLARRLP